MRSGKKDFKYNVRSGKKDSPGVSVFDRNYTPRVGVSGAAERPRPLHTRSLCVRSKLHSWSWCVRLGKKDFE